VWYIVTIMAVFRLISSVTDLIRYLIVSCLYIVFDGMQILFKVL